MSQRKAGLNIVLHAHLPYVHHPEYPHFLEENWLFEAITDCYLPLLAMLNRLEDDKVDYRLTLSFSPTLITLLGSDLLKQRYQHYLLARQQLIEAEINNTVNQPAVQRIAIAYRQRYQRLKQLYQQYEGELLAGFKHHQLSGKLTLITTAATHGFLPLLRVNEATVKQQIQIGLETFQSVFDFVPTGFWLPECAYYAGLENILKQHGLRYFFVDSHAIEGASEKSQQGIYAPLDCGNGVMAFGRDPVASRQVWSTTEGYPGDADYREFHRDIGYDRPQDYLANFLPEDQIPGHCGIKYHRITGRTEDKGWYAPEQALTKAHQHAAHFIQQRQRQVEALASAQTPLITVPFDAELFGHWWYEGPVWLEQVLRLAASDDYAFNLQSVEDYLAGASGLQQATPADSSWGEAGFYRYWLNDNNDWIYPVLHHAADELEKLAKDLKAVQLTPLQQRAINQAMRSLLLAQASDWSFILSANTTTEYAKQQIEDHLARFNYLLDGVRKNRLDADYVAALEIMDDIFPHLDFRRYW